MDNKKLCDHKYYQCICSEVWYKKERHPTLPDTFVVVSRCIKYIYECDVCKYRWDETICS